MTKYTTAKRALQKLGFKVYGRRNGWTILYHEVYDTYVSIKTWPIGHFDYEGKYWTKDAIMYCAFTSDGTTISYHFNMLWKREDEMYEKWHRNEEYKIVKQYNIDGIDRKIAEILCFAQHRGHWITCVEEL